MGLDHMMPALDWTVRQGLSFVERSLSCSNRASGDDILLVQWQRLISKETNAAS